jgi:hypothetical protein
LGAYIPSLLGGREGRKKGHSMIFIAIFFILVAAFFLFAFCRAADWGDRE